MVSCRRLAKDGSCRWLGKRMVRVHSWKEDGSRHLLEREWFMSMVGKRMVRVGGWIEDGPCL